MMADVYKVFAVRYAKFDRLSSENFIGGDPHDVSMPLFYYVWVIINESRTIVVDTGFDQASAERRHRQIDRPIREGLAAIGVDAGSVRDVIITHMHYDHAGNSGLFPAARFHLQEAEMAYSTGRCMCHELTRYPYDPDDVISMVRRVYEGRVAFCDGDREIFPGVSLHRIGGHSRGLQAVRVATNRGYVVLASDASHHYRHIQEHRVFPIVDSVPAVLDGYARITQLATSPDHIVPGHDPLVTTAYPAANDDLQGWVVRLDRPPVWSR